MSWCWAPVLVVLRVGLLHGCCGAAVAVVAAVGHVAVAVAPVVVVAMLVLVGVLCAWRPNSEGACCARGVVLSVLFALFVAALLLRRPHTVGSYLMAGGYPLLFELSFPPPPKNV